MPIITLCKVVSFKICQKLLLFFQNLFKINQIKFLHCELRVETLGRLLLRVHHDEMCFVVQQYCHSHRFELKRENRFQIAIKAFILVVRVVEFSSGRHRLFFLRSIAQFFIQIYMNCFVSSQVEQTR